jgi:hypothetical protein
MRSIWNRTFSKKPVRSLTFLLAGLFIIVSTPSEAQSRIPADANNWLQSGSNSDAGDPDRVNVIFYEIPDTITSTIYFAVYDAGIDTTAPDSYAAATNYDTDFYLIGGAGAISDPDARKQDYSSDTSAARTGTEIETFTATNDGTNDDNWTYFAGVQPSQGEKIGNK